MRRFRRSRPSANQYFQGQHRFEHWYRDNTVYFITARCWNKFPAFASEQAKEVFWDRFAHYTQRYHFEPFASSLLNNHYHTLGYLKSGNELGPMMQKIHGSVAKLVNDLLPKRLHPFWGNTVRDNYFDGCIRDELQFRRAFRYICLQSVRHRLVTDWRSYAHTRVSVPMDEALRLSIEREGFMEKVPYPRYSRGKSKSIPSSAAQAAPPEGFDFDLRLE